MTIFECDGCGRQERCPSGHKPHVWYVRTMRLNADGTEDKRSWLERRDGPGSPGARDIHACSRECIETSAAKLGTHSLVVPF